MRGIATVIAVSVTLASVACAPPKVMVDHSYASANKSIETFIQRSAAVTVIGNSSEKTNLFNVFMRVCNQDSSNTMASCKDTLVVSNVSPESL